MENLSERDICTKHVTPALMDAGWNLYTQIREEVSLTDGRIIVRGKLTSRGKQKRADYILYHKPNIPIAIVEAKDARHSVGAGMQQALNYAQMIDVPFAFSTNGRGILIHDKSGPTGPIEREIPLQEMPSPDELWKRYAAWKGISSAENPLVNQDFYDDGAGKAPRYYHGHDPGVGSEHGDAQHRTAVTYDAALPDEGRLGRQKAIDWEQWPSLPLCLPLCLPRCLTPGPRRRS